MFKWVIFSLWLAYCCSQDLEDRLGLGRESNKSLQINRENVTVTSLGRKKLANQENGSIEEVP